MDVNGLEFVSPNDGWLLIDLLIDWLYIEYLIEGWFSID